MANSKLEIVDSVIRDQLKQNAALLELLAYGDSVYPNDKEFEDEHNRFVEVIRSVLITAEFFVVSAIYGADPKLPVVSTFGLQDSPDKELAPGASQLLLGQSETAGSGVVAKLNEWAPRCDVYILPYVVKKTSRVSETISKDGVLSALSVLNEEKLLDEFIHTRAGLRGTFSSDSLGDGYFRAYTCLGIKKTDVKALKDHGVVITPLLLETLMIFYQMSWSNREIIKRDRQKANQVRNQEMAEMYAKTREPLERLVVQLQGVMRPLNDLQSILAPVRGLFGSNIVDERFFRIPEQSFTLRDAELTIAIAHDFEDFSRNSTTSKTIITNAARQIAVVVLQAFGELKNSQEPLWEFLKFTLRFGNKYRGVADILLNQYEDLFDHGMSTFGTHEEMERILPRITDLFNLIKYWFHRAGRVSKPMRSDYLMAGLGMVFPSASKKKVVMAGIVKDIRNSRPEDSAFWVSSMKPVETLAGLEALCYAQGELDDATLTVESEGTKRVATLDLVFSASADDPAQKPLDKIVASCRNSDVQTSHSRGNMAFAVMNIFGDVPTLRNRTTLGETETALGGTLERVSVLVSATMEFKERSIRIQWKAQPPGALDL